MGNIYGCFLHPKYGENSLFKFPVPKVWRKLFPMALRTSAIFTLIGFLKTVLFSPKKLRGQPRIYRPNYLESFLKHCCTASRFCVSTWITCGNVLKPCSTASSFRSCMEMSGSMPAGCLKTKCCCGSHPGVIGW